MSDASMESIAAPQAPEATERLSAPVELLGDLVLAVLVLLGAGERAVQPPAVS
jgi:hypothetical protein